MALIDQLNALRDSLRITPAGPINLSSAGQTVTAQILPPGAQLTATDLVSNPISLDLVAKGVMFSDADPSHKTVSGTWPIYDLTKVPPTLLAGVPGFLGQLTGALYNAVSVPVQVEAKWSVHAVNTDGSRGAELTDGQNYVAPTGLGAPQVSVLLVPQLQELTTDSPTPSTVARFLHVRVRLSAAGFTTSWTDNVPDLRVTAPELGFPAVLALFLEKNLLGGAFVMVPANSAFQSLPDLRTVLSKLRTALGAISSVSSTAKRVLDLVVFLAGVSALVEALDSSGQVLFDVKQAVPDLSVYVFDPGVLGFIGRLTASNSMDSLIFLGLPGERVECYANSPFITRDGWFSITLPDGEFFSTIADLESSDPVASPNHEAITVEVHPPKQWFRPYHFANEIDSVNFGSR